MISHICLSADLIHPHLWLKQSACCNRHVWVSEDRQCNFSLSFSTYHSTQARKTLKIITGLDTVSTFLVVPWTKSLDLRSRSYADTTNTKFISKQLKKHAVDQHWVCLCILTCVYIYRCTYASIILCIYGFYPALHTLMCTQDGRELPNFVHTTCLVLFCLYILFYSKSFYFIWAAYIKSVDRIQNAISHYQYNKVFKFSPTYLCVC